MHSKFSLRCAKTAKYAIYLLHNNSLNFTSYIFYFVVDANIVSFSAFARGILFHFELFLFFSSFESKYQIGYTKNVAEISVK